MRLFGKLPVCLLAFSVGLACFAGPNQTLPFSDNFQDYNPGDSLIDGINGWYGSAPSVAVQTEFFSPKFGVSSQSAEIPFVETLSNTFENISVTSLWVTMDIMPVLYQSDLHPVVDPQSSAVFYIGSNGYFVVANGADNWEEVLETDKGDAAHEYAYGDWVRLHVFQNYTESQWDLFVDNIRLKKDIAFVSNIVATLNSIEIRNGGATNAYLDNFLVSTNLPVDLGEDGGDWLPTLKVGTNRINQIVMQDENAPSQTFEVWKTNGTCDLQYDISVSTNWLSVDQSSGESSGEVDTITINYNTAHLRRGVYTGVISIVATDADYGFPAKDSPREIEVILEVDYLVPSLGRDPANLIQEVQKGANATNQTIRIWNATSHYRADYAVNSDKVWVDCNPSLGATTGEVDEVVISYDTAAFDEGTYTATITITGRDHTYGDVLDPRTVGVTIIVSVPPGPPAGSVQASDGDFDDKIHVHWGTVDDAVSYEVWRGDNFDSSYANRIADTAATNFFDTGAEPGVKYYYWIRPKNAYGWTGGFGSYDSGYRAMNAPAGIFVSQGSYTNKIRIWWAEVDGAATYEVWRNESRSSSSAVRIKHTSATSFEDIEVERGRTYYYWVKAKSMSYVSAFSARGSGFTLVEPASVSATDGAYVGMIAVTWKAVPGATSYEIWRNAMPVLDSAVKVGSSYGAAFNDTSIEGTRKYYYWVRASTPTAQSGFGGWADGFGAYGYADLQASSFVFLPRNFAPGASPSAVSLELRNGGPQDIASPNSKIKMSFYLSADAKFGNADDELLGSVSRNISLAAGDGMSMQLSESERNALKIPSGILGSYYVFVKVAHVSPSSLVDPYPDTAVARRDSQISAGDPEAPTIYHVSNDYTGDGRADIAVYDPATGAWYIRNLRGDILAWGEPWGAGGFEPVFGDYNGDGKADMAVYHQQTGKWYIRGLDGTMLAWGISWGGPGFEPCYGDYDGDGKTDLGVYSEAEGKRYICSLSQDILLWGMDWGAPGFASVPGDFNGSGISDIAVYQEATGEWYIRSVDGNLVLWAEAWGGPGYTAVPGDFDGDGRDDMAVYHQESGTWYINSVRNGPVVWAEAWGGPGYTAVPGDYNGDGISDMAVYNAASGRWYIRSVSGATIAWDMSWGGPSLTPVGASK